MFSSEVYFVASLFLYGCPLYAWMSGTLFFVLPLKYLFVLSKILGIRVMLSDHMSELFAGECGDKIATAEGETPEISQAKGP